MPCRCQRVGRGFGAGCGCLTLIVFVLFGLLSLYVWYGWVPGLSVTSVIDWAGPSNPLYKTVAVTADAWKVNFQTYPALLIVPALGLLGAGLSALFARRWPAVLVFGASKATIVGVI